MTIKEYAELVHRKESTIRAGIHNGFIKTYKDERGKTAIDPRQPYTYGRADDDQKWKKWSGGKAKIHRWESDTDRTLVNVLSCMKHRCYFENDSRYYCYGGKGVRICDEWLNDSATFVEWAKANGYEPGLTIDRIDSDGNYEPSNCRWITRSENSSRAAIGKAQKKARWQELENQRGLEEAIATESQKQWYVFRSIKLNPRYKISKRDIAKTEFYMDHLLTGFTETMLDNIFFFRHRQDFFREENDNYYEIETPSREYIETYVKKLYYLD